MVELSLWRCLSCGNRFGAAHYRTLCFWLLVFFCPLFIIWSFFCVSDLIYNVGYMGRPCTIVNSLGVLSDLRSTYFQLTITGRFLDSDGIPFSYSFTTTDNYALDQFVKLNPPPSVQCSNDTLSIGGLSSLLDYRATYNSFLVASSALVVPRNVTCYVRGSAWTAMRLYPVSYNVTNVVLWAIWGGLSAFAICMWIYVGHREEPPAAPVAPPPPQAAWDA